MTAESLLIHSELILEKPPASLFNPYGHASIIHGVSPLRVCSRSGQTQLALAGNRDLGRDVQMNPKQKILSLTFSLKSIQNKTVLSIDTHPQIPFSWRPIG